MPSNDITTLWCSGCKQYLPSSEFYRERVTKKNKRGYRRDCKRCSSAAAMAWNHKNRDRVFAAHLRRRFGITVEQWDAMLEAQGGVCAICGEPPTIRNSGPFRRRRRKEHSAEQPEIIYRLVVDHDHATGEVRGLLCYVCNTGIGMLGDTADRVRFALKYLEG